MASTLAGQLDEAVVEAEVVPDRVLPASSLLPFVVGKLLLDVLVNLTQLQLPLFAVLNAHRDHGDVAVRRFGVNIWRKKKKLILFLGNFSFLFSFKKFNEQWKVERWFNCRIVYCDFVMNFSAINKVLSNYMKSNNPKHNLNFTYNCAINQLNLKMELWLVKFCLPLCFESGFIILILLSSVANVVDSFFFSDVFRRLTSLSTLLSSSSSLMMTLSSSAESSLSSNSSGLIVEGSGCRRFRKVGTFWKIFWTKCEQTTNNNVLITAGKNSELKKFNPGTLK